MDNLYLFPSNPNPSSKPSGLQISGSLTLSRSGFIVSADQFCSHNLSAATLVFSDVLMMFITSSIFAIATMSPSTIWPLSLACLSSYKDLFVMTSFRCFRKISSSSCRLHNFGLPSTRTTLLMPKTCSS